MNDIFETETFTKLYGACDNREKQWIDEIKNSLRENLSVGKTIRFNWFREKKFGNKRLYFMINEKSKKAVLLAYGEKKEQQKIIDHIIINKEIYFRFIN